MFKKDISIVKHKIPFKKASRPYFSILEDWIYRGQLNDPYNEFMIGENKDKPRNDKKDEECLNEKYPLKKKSFIYL